MRTVSIPAWFGRSIGVRRGPARLDWQIILLLVALGVFGTVSIYSSTLGDPVRHPSALKQMAWLGLGLALATASIWVDYRKLIGNAHWVYFGTLLLLVATILLGKRTHGAARWLDIPGIPMRVQPSEFAKLVLVLVLSRILAGRSRPVEKLTDCLGPVFVTVPMALLIFKQPDLGTTMVLGPILAGMLFVAGLSGAYYLFALPLGLALLGPPLEDLALHSLLSGWAFSLVWGGILVITVSAAWACRIKRFDLLLMVLLCGLAYFGAPRVWSSLRDYQRTRVISFLDPNADPRGAGYHLRQARIALGSGGMTGQGWGGGAQSRLRFLPEYQTDFAFAALGEQWGFVGASTFLILFLLLLLRGISIAVDARRPEGTLLAAGISLYFAVHVMINVGICLGFLPVTGLPLAFLSYGGSAMLTNLLAGGLLVNVRLRKFAE